MLFICIYGFNFFRNNRLQRGGGICVYVKNKITAENILHDFDRIQDVEFICVKIKIRKETLLRGIFYRPLSSSINPCIEYLDNFLSFITPQFQNIIILDKFNIIFL